MVIVESYAVAVVMCFITMLCWGSWANTLKLASKKWRFQLFYWDYTVGVLLFALFMAFTMGSMGSAGRSFITDLGQADISSIWLALFGGIIFNISNILIVGAIDIAGLAVAFPVGVGLALVVGVITNYIATPVGNPVLLFLGVASVVVAIVLDAVAYKKLPRQGQKTPMKGIMLSIFGGVLMGFFYRFLVASMSLDFINLEPGKLSPYTGVVVLAFGIFLSNFVWNSIVMAKPFVGEPVPFKDYFIKGNTRLHLIGIFGGAIWCLGTSLSIIASGSAGFPISYGLGQGATMVGALWGVFIWKEFKGAPAGTNKFLILMFAFFILGLGIIIISRLI